MDFKQIKTLPHPKNIKGKLRDYQKTGYEWLHFLHINKVGGILADDMGLGKTIQAISFLNDLYVNSNNKTLPTIIILPTSLVFNWKNELEKLAPYISYFDYTGPTRDINEFIKNSKGKSNNFHLLITTYSLMYRDSHILMVVLKKGKIS